MSCAASLAVFEALESSPELMEGILAKEHIRDVLVHPSIENISGKGHVLPLARPKIDSFAVIARLEEEGLITNSFVCRECHSYHTAAGITTKNSIKD